MIGRRLASEKEECEQKSNRKSQLNSSGLTSENTGSNLLSSSSQKTTILNTCTIPEFKNRITEKELLNSHRDLNRHFGRVNSELLVGGTYYGKIVVCQDYAVFDLSFLTEWFNNVRLLKVMRPQLGEFGKRFVSIGKIRASAQRNYYTMTKTEVLGRLVYCGFKIVQTEEQSNILSFKARKISKPGSTVANASSLLFKATRVGKDGKDIKVYKLRTMYPYAQFLQSYVYEQNNLEAGGKFKGDFRISKRGKFLRKYFLDEIPMIWNLIKGDIKMVGVRPISRHYLSLYSEEFQLIRNKAKPGLLPPFYVDFPDSIEKIQMSELNYLEQYRRNPWLTDVKYFFRIVYNIIFGRVRSK